jgi:hypothetical protein
MFIVNVSIYTDLYDFDLSKEGGRGGFKMGKIK